MSTLHTLQTLFEIVFIVVLILAIVYEPVLVKWEQAQKEKILQAIKKRSKL